MISFFGKGKNVGFGDNDNMGIIAKLSRAVSDPSMTEATKRMADDAAFVAKKLVKSTGKAAWYALTTFLVLGLPYVFVSERYHQQLNDQELEKRYLLGSPPPVSAYRL